MKVTNLVNDKPFLGYHYYILTLFDLCLGIEKTISKEKMHSTLWLIWAHHGTRTPYPGVTKFTILVGPSLVIIIINFVSLFVLCIRVETNIFKEKFQFYTFYPKITSSLQLGGGVHEIYNVLSPYPRDAAYKIWLRLPSSSWEDVNGRRTSQDTRRTTTDANP